MEIDKDLLMDLQEVHLDLVGNVYSYNGKIIRIVNKDAVRHVKRLMDSGLIKALIERDLLVDTIVSDYTYDGRMVLEHRKIEPYSHVSQWSFEMRKSAAILVLNINLLCMEYGYELKDCHQDNILFDGIKPIYIDFGSIVKKTEDRCLIENEFLKVHYYPLKLYAKGYMFTVDALMKSAKNLEEMRRIYYAGVPRIIIQLCGEVSAFIKKKTAVQWMNLYISHINKLNVCYKTVWGKYQNSYWNKTPNKRFEYEINWINKVNDIETMVEIGANQGNFAFLVSTMTDIKKIIATDYDPQAVDNMYKKLRVYNKERNNITPLILDFIDTPIQSLKRYKSDLVVANALTHHLLLTQKLSIKVLVERLSNLTGKYVIVEFMPNGVNRSRSKTPKWYTLDWFLENLQQQFEIISVDKVEKRIIIIGKKKRDIEE